MKGLLINTAVFAIGAGLGAVVSWKLLEEKYKQIANEEIKSVKEVYAKKFETDKFESVEFELGDLEDDGSKEECANIIKKFKYTNEEVTYDMKKPYVIAPEEFGELDDYETVSLTYYEDNVLTDDQDEPIEDVDKLVGKDFASHYGEYEEDSVFIRNEELKTDYEILKDSRNYHNPHPTEDE